MPYRIRLVAYLMLARVGKAFIQSQPCRTRAAFFNSNIRTPFLLSLKSDEEDLRVLSEQEVDEEISEEMWDELNQNQPSQLKIMKEVSTILYSFEWRRRYLTLPCRFWALTVLRIFWLEPFYSSLL